MGYLVYPPNGNVFFGGTHVKETLNLGWYSMFRQSHNVLNIVILCLSVVLEVLLSSFYHIVRYILWMGNISHQLVDGLSHYNPTIYDVFSSQKFPTGSGRVSQPSTVLLIIYI